jgi:hypothetical protein
MRTARWFWQRWHVLPIRLWRRHWAFHEDLPASTSYLKINDINQSMAN